MSAHTDSIRLFDLDTLVEPYEAYRTLRDEAPVHYVAELNLHVVTRYDLVREAIKDSTTYSSRFDEFFAQAGSARAAGMDKAARAQLKSLHAQLIPTPPTMLTLDEPEHTQYRSLVSRLFTGSEIKRSEATVRGVIEQAADRFVASTNSDFMAGYAFPVPLRIIADRLGIPEADRSLFDEAATAAAAGLRLSPISADEAVHRVELAVALQRLLVDIIEARRKAPRDDMISILATETLEHAQRPLTHGEALSILNQFLVAGHETTTSAFGWGMLLLCERPDLQSTLRDDTSLTRTFVEEVLRLESPVQGLPRRVTRDTTLGGCSLAEGDFIMLRYGAANRDEREFTNPDQADLGRKKAGRQLAFGSGVHHCIGAPLARQELNLGFPALLERMADIRLAQDRPPPRAEPSLILRNLPDLHIRFDRR